MVIEALKKNKARLIVFACDVSPRLVGEIEKAAERYSPSVSCAKLEETINDIHFSLGYKAGVIAVNDENFANRITELLNQEENEYGDKN